MPKSKVSAGIRQLHTNTVTALVLIAALTFASIAIITITHAGGIGGGSNTFGYNCPVNSFTGRRPVLALGADDARRHDQCVHVAQANIHAYFCPVVALYKLPATDYRAIYCNAPIDGVFGKVLFNAVKDYQTAQKAYFPKLKPTSIVDEPTWASWGLGAVTKPGCVGNVCLKNIFAPPPPPPPACTDPRAGCGAQPANNGN